MAAQLGIAQSRAAPRFTPVAPTLSRRLIGAPRRTADQRYLRQLETSAKIALKVVGLLDLHEFMAEFRRLVSEAFGYDQIRLFVWWPADGCFRSHPDDAGLAALAEIPRAQAGPLASVLEDDCAVLVAGNRAGPRGAPDSPSLDPSTRAIVPVHFAGQVIGVLDMHSHARTRHRRSELVALQCLADHVGVSLHTSALYAEAITGRRRAEDADRLKTRLLANVTHELRAPLNVILGYSQAALATRSADGAELSAAARRDLEHIYASGDHLLRLINDLLDLSRAEVDALDLFLEEVTPGAFLDEVFQQARSQVPPLPNVTWRLDLPPALPVVRADPVRLRQVLDNLLNNARAATGAGEIVLGAAVEDGQLHIWVRDTGEGIAFEQLEHVFEPFVSGQRPDQRRKGTGLGLTISRRLVALHGGTLEADSAPGRGSTFHVRVPVLMTDDDTAGSVSLLMKPAGGQAVLGAIEALQPAQATGTVLVVDDDPHARDFYSQLVKQALPDCSVVTAADGAVALRLLLEQAIPPTLVILDLALPEVDGFAVLEQLRADRRTRHVPVLVVSGRLLSNEDVRRLDHARVLYQAKHLLSPSEALALLQDAAAGDTLLPQPTSAVVKHAMAYLHEHYARPLARHDLAVAVGVSENYLSQIFHRELRVSPREYLSRVRMHKARELLSSTDESITAIASQVGFEDSAYFSRVFHKLVGASPQTFRQLS